MTDKEIQYLVVKIETQNRYNKIDNHLKLIYKELKKDPVLQSCKMFFDSLIGLYFTVEDKKYYRISIGVNSSDSKNDIFIGFYTLKALKSIDFDKAVYKDCSFTWDLVEDTKLIKSIILPYI